MTFQRIAGVSVGVVLTAAVAAGQPRSEPTGQSPTTVVFERTYAGGSVDPWRRVQTRTVSGGREVVVETHEVPDIDGRWSPIQETVTETIHTAPDAERTTRDVFGFAGDRRRTLLETTESVHETRANGDTSTTHNTWAPDINGRLGLTSRRFEQTRAAAPDARQTETTVLVPHYNEALRAAEQTETLERQVSPGVIRRDSTYLVRDINGRWQQVETRTGEASEVGASERVEQETIHRPDMNGRLVVDERTVTRRSNANAQDDVVVETYAPDADGGARSSRELALSQRVHRTTTATADGGRHTVEAVEDRNPVAPSEPMRVIRRTETTVRPIGSDRWVTERQVFERDVNGRMRLVFNDAEEGPR